jgi:hypothetical protein
VWYSRRLVVYSADKSPCGHQRRIETRRHVVFTPPRCLRRPRGGVRKEKIRGSVQIARRLVVHAAGTGNDEEVGIGGTVGAPSLLVVSENPGERRIISSFPLRILPSSPPLLAIAPDPFSLPSYMPFDSVTWRRWGVSLGSLGADDVASVGGLLGGGDVALFAAFLTASGAGDVASVGGVVGCIW